MKTTQLGASLALVGLASAIAAACGGSHSDPFSMVGNDGGASNTGANGQGATSATGGNGSSGTLNIPTGGADNSNAGDNGAGGATCGSTRVAANPPVVNVLLVVDKSFSETDTPAGFATDKWTALRSALTTTLDQTKDKISFGLDLFPYSGKSGEALTDSCEMPTTDAVVVPVDVGTKTAPLIVAALKANPPSGATPTALALARADAYFTTGAGMGLKGEKYVLLATDGGPNCGDVPSCTIDTCTVNLDGKSCGGPDVNCCDPKSGDAKGAENCLDQTGSVAAVAKLAKHGIKTFVVGIPGTEAYSSTLDALAAKSGVTNPDAPPKYFAVSAKSGAAGLSDVLTRITAGLVTSCKLQLEEVPPVPDDVYVVVGDDNGGVALKQGDPNGWVYDNSVSPPAIVIQGTTCQKLEAQGAPYINVSYGCPVFEPPK